MTHPLFAHKLDTTALLLVGHGSTVNDDSSASLRRLADAPRLRDCFGRVIAGFWKEEPFLSEVLDDIREPQVFVVPFFISDGYFTEHVVPEQLGFKQAGQSDIERVITCGPRTLFYCQPVGTHDRMTEAVLSRAREVVQTHPFPRRPVDRDITLFIAGHGTMRHARSRASVERQANIIRARGDYSNVHAVFMEEAPGVGDCYDMASTRHLVIVPFFLSDGLHVCEDIPVLLGEPERVVEERMAQGRSTWRNPTERRGKLVWYSPSVGTAPLLVDIILDRVGQAMKWERSRVG